MTNERLHGFGGPPVNRERSTEGHGPAASIQAVTEE